MAHGPLLVKRTTMRKLASIRRCTAVHPIPKADRIELAIVDGWQCVVSKGAVQPGDLGVYYEVDSFLPANDPRYAHMSSQFREWNGRQGLKLGTREFRGQVAQGLFLPLAQFPELVNFQLGDDVTNALNIIKWEMDIPDEMKALVTGAAPEQVSDTELERVQNVLDLYELYGDEEYEVSIKLDGMSLTMYQLERFGVCTKRYDFIDSDDFAGWRLARAYGVDKALAAIGGMYAIQGELIGSKIGKNKERLPGGTQEFHVFNIEDLAAGRALLPAERMEFMKELQGHGSTVKHTPVLPGYKTLREWAPDLQSLLKLADGPTVLYPGGLREGLVFKSTTTQHRFKVISNKQLLKDE